MDAARIRVRLKGSRVYLLPQPRPSMATAMLAAARDAAHHPMKAWAVVTFGDEDDGDHGSFCEFAWPASAGPIHLMPAAVAERLREALFG